MNYFAYGSNLDFGQMKKRCPSAQFHSRACLKDHRLAFTRLSEVRLCGVADCVASKGTVVWGVVYEIDDEDMAALDAYEGFSLGRPRERNRYAREERRVLLDGKESFTAWVYFVVKPEDEPQLPNTKYKRHIVKGARRWQLPQDYVVELERIRVSDA